MVIAARPSTDLGWFLFWICVGILNSVDMESLNKKNIYFKYAVEVPTNKRLAQARKQIV